MNAVVCSDAVEYLRRMPADSVPMTLTSPPYGGLRVYGGRDARNDRFVDLARGLWRVTTPGGVLVWVTGDTTVTRGPRRGSEAGTPIFEAHLLMAVGFLLWDTMIYHKRNPIPRPAQRRYTPAFEYMFVLSKGPPRTFNAITEPCRYAGRPSTGTYFEKPDTEVPYRGSKKGKTIADTKPRGNVWSYWVGRNTGRKGAVRFHHPAVMSLDLALDHLRTWTSPGDLVFDPMCGSGTTLVAARELDRRYLGTDIDPRYVAICRERLSRLDGSSE